MYATSLHCFYCSADFPLTHRGSCTICAKVGEESALNETLGVQYNVAAIKSQLDREELARRPGGLWRYRELLPVVDPTFRIDLGAGGTRLAPLTRIPEASAGNRLFMKVEGSNPSGSFKDRPIGVAASVALEQGARGLACLTSGNIGSAMAAIAAKAGVSALVLLLGAAGLADQGTSVNVEKYVQISAYGAEVVTPIGNLGQLYALADRIEAELGWSFMHNVQAYQSDGDKTTAFEICEQLGWRAPAAVFVPTGTGTNLFGLWQGFVLFKELGFIDTLPRMFAVQPLGAASLAAAWEAHQTIPAVLQQVEPNLAPPISHRVSGYHAFKAIQESGGGAVAVADADMLAALKDLASYEAIYAETASAAALAGIRRALALGLLRQEETRQVGIVGILTSHGLKNSLALTQVFTPPPKVDGTWEALRDFLQKDRQGGKEHIYGRAQSTHPD
ncbi:MAG TPA: pyridoxal-phosphate dependent enzyme [Ktedonobacteraceae bacterium]|nr:pyridoxal-phosphate dependent enzyme [Ktedonobacteraceae bacterium]